MSRESFSMEDPKINETIQRLAPNANQGAFRSVIEAFYREVVQGSPDTPTPQAVDGFLGQQTLTGDEKVQLRGILLEIFQIKPGPSEEREAKQIKFQPDGNALQPKMGALLPISKNAPPGDYVTADPDPVLPDTKKMAQLPSLNRGGSGEAAAYTWDMAAYQQADVAGQYPSKGFVPPSIPPKHVREGMSTMAGTTTVTNEIYGPRVPKDRGTPRQAKEDGLAVASDIYPSIYGPSMRPATKPQTGLGDLTGQDTIPATAFVIPSLPKTEPVPFLTDFRAFGK